LSATDSVVPAPHLRSLLFHSDFNETVLSFGGTEVNPLKPNLPTTLSDNLVSIELVRSLIALTDIKFRSKKTAGADALTDTIWAVVLLPEDTKATNVVITSMSNPLFR